MKTKKKHISDTKQFLGEKITVFKKDFEIFEHSLSYPSYYSISIKNSFGANNVWGGDPADEDSYNKRQFQIVFKNWDGQLEWTGDKYGYQIAF